MVQSSSLLAVTTITNHLGRPFVVARDGNEYALLVDGERIGEVVLVLVPATNLLYVASVEIGMSYRGGKLCTPFLAAALRDFLDRTRPPPIHASVLVQSFDLERAATCYTNAFKIVGFDPTYVGKRTVDDHTGKPTQQLSFARSAPSDDEMRQRQKRRLRDFLGS